MKKITLLIAAVILFFCVVSASAMEIAWMYVQHRQYGETKSINRLGFGLVDDKLDYLSGDLEISEITLFDPSGKPVKLAPHEFGKVEEIYGSYDSKNSRWYFSRGWEFDSWFSADILAPLAAGQYRLKVTAADGKTAERGYTFNRQINLPVISADSFSVRSDPEGNIIWTWVIPDELGRLSQALKTRARASIDIFADNSNLAYFSIILPVHMGYGFIPRDVVERINRKGDRFEMKISIETRDKNSRSYSKSMVFHQRLPHNQ